MLEEVGELGVLWRYFDAIYCINLERAVQRREKMSNIFEQYQIPVIFFKAVEDKNCNRGCLLSHKTIYNQALQQGFRRILIFEDDLIPTGYVAAEYLQHCIDYMEKNPWDIFFLGAVPDNFGFRQVRTSTANIYRIHGICTHAYALSVSGLEKMKDIHYSPLSPLDYVIKRREDLHCFATYPSMFYQETGYKLPQWMITTGLRINEFYAYYVGIPLKYMFWVGLGLVVAIVVWKSCRKRS